MHMENQKLQTIQASQMTGGQNLPVTGAAGN
jgi:hypothetical protein